MNILDITNEDIARLQENKIVFGLLNERDREIFGFIGTGNTDRYCSTGFFRCREGGIFQENAVYRIISDYQLPTPTEADIIAYLKASEVAPSQWPPVVQEWARRHDNEPIWEYISYNSGDWEKSYSCQGTAHIHRLRADYGEKKETEIPAEFKEFAKQVCETFKEPEVCKWTFSPCYPCKCWRGPHNTMNHFADECFKYCPDCGKKIEIREDD